MRRFIILAHDVPTHPEFSLDDLPGGAGRLDVLCRCVTAGLLRSHGVRTDSEVIVVIQDELVVRFDGASIRRLNPDERSTAARFREAIADAEDAIGSISVDSSPGVSVARGDFTSVLSDIDGNLVQLHEDGEPLPALEPAEPVTFLLSDHRPFDENKETRASEFGARRICLGPEALHADQAITIANNYLDTNGYRTY